MVTFAVLTSFTASKMMMRRLRETWIAGKISVRQLFKPIIKPKKKVLTQNNRSNGQSQTCWQFITTMSFSKFQSWLFPTMPEHYPFSKKLALAKSQSTLGNVWDILLIFMSVVACGIYVSETYDASYHAVQFYSVVEMVVTQFFAADFLYNFMSCSNTIPFLLESWTIVDLLTIVPVYFTLWLRANESEGHGVNLSVFRFVRILRLIRIMRMFKLLNGLSGVQRQLVTLTLTLVSLVFMAAGIIHIMENDLKQIMEYSCTYINADTNWAPSCTSNTPFDAANPGTCDCVGIKYSCFAVYDAADNNNQPSGISCPIMTFLDAFYFIIVTVSTVGFGDISPTTQASRAVVVMFIMTSVVLIPIQVNQLSVLLAASSAYRQPFNRLSGESHIIICGYIGDWRKLEKFFKEFFHPDRNYSAAPDFHAVILSPVEPSDDLKALLYSTHFDGKLTYIIGSSLSTEDLQKARADVASAMFFFCNAETPEENAKLDDAATVLRTLSVSNFNANLECFVQVLKPEDRDILKDSDVDVIMCLDEYKTCIQARNSICPGISTLVENLFHTFSVTSAYAAENNDADSGNMNQWVKDYAHGLAMEPYYIPLVPRYCEMLSYEWTLMVEGVYLEWDCLIIGVASSNDHSLLLNPGSKEMKKFQYNSRFFKKYNMLILLCNEQSQASSIASGLDDPHVIDRILNKILVAEETFTVRRHTEKRSDVRRKKDDKGVSSNLRDIIRVTKSWSGFTSKVKPGDAPDSDDEDAYVGYIAKTAHKSAESAKKLAHLNKLTYATKLQGIGGKTIDEGSDEEDSGEEEDEGEDVARIPGIMNSSPLTSSRKTGLVGSVQAKMKRMNSMAQGRPTSLLPTVATDPTLATAIDSNPDLQHQQGVMEAEAASVAAGGDTVLVTTEALTDSQVPNLVEDAFALEGHIIVFGCTTNIFLFLTELRRDIHKIGPGMDKPPAVVVIDDVPPRVWNYVCEAFTDVYFIRGKMTRSFDFNRTNIAKAKSVALLAGRDHVTKIEEENLDAEALFAYLKLEKYIPKGVFFTVELTCVSNMAVLNSTVLRRQRMNEKVRQNHANAKEKARKEAKEAARKEKERLAAAAKKSKENPEDMSARFSEQNKADAVVASLLIEKPIPPTADISTGTFSTHKACMKSENYEHLSRGIMNVIAGVPARRVSSVETKEGPKLTAGGKTAAGARLASFWTPQDSHQMLSVFASGNAFVPATFDSILAQSFYTAFTPLLCERLVCGSKYQSMFQVKVPDPFVNRYFVDLYRAFMSRGLMVIALYRAPVTTDGAILPFVLTSPSAGTLIHDGDKLFIVCNPKTLTDNLSVLTEPLVEWPDGSLSLGDTLGIQLGFGLGPNEKKNQNEESKAASGDDASADKVSDNGYRYIQTVEDKDNRSPMKSQVSQVFFKGTSNPL